MRERTGNPDHASVDDVRDLLLSRVANPRAEPREEDFDDTMAAIVDRYGEVAVREVVHLVLVGRISFRTAVADLDIRSIDGVRIGPTAGWFLRELNAATDR